MGSLIADISVSLDGYVAGPDSSLKEPLGKNGEQLHEWVIATASWRQSHGQTGGEAGVDDEISREMSQNTGATIMGRNMFSGGDGPWESDANRDGWWGDEPPFHHPVFVLTHHERDTVSKKGGTSFEFVTSGIMDALTRAREAAGDKDILIAGGGDVIQQYVQAGLVDEIRLHTVPILLGGGASLFQGEHKPDFQKWELVRVAESPTGVVHTKYRKESE